jgi:hypothetical protein
MFVVGRVARSSRLARFVPSDQFRAFRTVYAGEGLFVSSAGHAVLLRYALEDGHGQVLVVGGDVGAFIDRRQFVLAGGHFVVARLDGHAQLVELALDLEHERQHALGDGAEVLVFHLLAFRRLGAEERTARADQIRPREEEVAVHEKVFLFAAGRGEDAVRILLAEHPQQPLRLRVEHLHRAQQGGFLVQRLARPRTEGRRNAQRGAVGVFQDVGGAGHVPRGVAARLERGADAAGGEARRVRFALDELLGAEFRQRAALAVRLQEAVVLFGRETGQRIEDVGVVRGALFDGPVAHGDGDLVGDRDVQLLALVDRSPQRLVGGLRQARLHRPVVEHVRPENVAGGRLGEIQRLRRRPVVRHRRDRVQSRIAHRRPLSVSFLTSSKSNSFVARNQASSTFVAMAFSCMPRAKRRPPNGQIRRNTLCGMIIKISRSF